MKRSTVTLFLLLLTLPQLWAQDDSLGRVRLALRNGIGYGLYRDAGVSPLTYKGYELTPGVTMLWEQPRWHYALDLSLLGGGYGFKPSLGSIQAFGGHAHLKVSALRQVGSSRMWRLWVGVSLSDVVDLRYNDAFSNACLGVSNFTSLGMVGRAECRLRRWVFHGQLCLTPLSLLFRPGFAYMDNFDQDIGDPMANMLDQYAFYVAGATSLVTSFGVTFRLLNGNRVALVYDWRYLTSRTSADGVSAPHLFQQAGHVLAVQLDFSL